MTIPAGGRRSSIFRTPPLLIAILVLSVLYLTITNVEVQLSSIAALVRETRPQEGSAPGTGAPGWGFGRSGPAPSADGVDDKVHSEDETSAPQNKTEDAQSNSAAETGGTETLTQSKPGEGEDKVYGCRELPGANDVLLVIKTGATEIFNKLPTHLITTTTCVPDFVVFSDLEQTMSDITIHDALKDISSEWKSREGPLSKLYPKLKEHHSKGLDVTDLAKEGAWELDKWKNIPTAVAAYEQYPDKKWFLFIDADSAILWSNLLLWVATLNPSEPLYLGSPVYIGDTTFAHGGSGYLASQAAVKLIAEKSAEKKLEWERRTSQVCCGDQMFAEALLASNIHVKSAVPIIQGLTPRSVDYDDWHWCKAPVTFHHVTTAEVEELWRWEQEMVQKNGRDKPLLYADMFAHFVAPTLFAATDETENALPDSTPETARKNWDNLASGGNTFDAPPDTEAAGQPGPYSSREACIEACKNQKECLQWRWKPGKCALGNKPCLGRRPYTYWDPNYEPMDSKMESGWLEDRVRTYVERLGHCDVGKAFDA